MKFGISYNTGYYGADPGNVVAVARHAEACGFESFYVPEHIALYPGATGGGTEFPASLAVADPLECLSFVAAATERILLGTAVLLLPYHHPVVLAKRLATIDVLSRGRMRLLTVGVGTLPGEAQAMGVDFSFTRLCSFPKPWNTATLPVHVGGSSPAAARRAGRRGDGYFPGGRLTAAERVGQIELMRAAAAEAGRDPGALDYTRWGSADLSAADVEVHDRNGTTRLVVGPSSLDLAEQCAEISAFADRLELPRSQ